MPDKIWGADAGAWDHFSFILGLTEDLLPVVSDATAKISPESNMQAIGKTPSCFNRRGLVVGISGWTQKISEQSDLDAWARDTRLGMCLQTRNVRAFDIDVDNPELAGKVAAFITAALGTLPCRTRPNSGKRLFLFSLPGELPKRVIKFDGGMVEMLGTGQQCIISGTHTSGARYEWPAGFPSNIPEVSLEQLDALWLRLAEAFGGVTSQASASTRADVLHAAVTGDPTATHLVAERWVKQQSKEGSLHILCPFEAGHSGPSSVSATTYFPAHTGGYDQGHFKCLHASCSGRTQDEFRAAVGIRVADPFEGFYALPEESNPDIVKPMSEGSTAPEAAKAPRFQVVPAHEFADHKPPGWIVKNVLPKAGLAVVYGESGSGKSFWALDICAAIARGESWRGNRVQKGKVAYVCAEGAGGMRSRLRAYGVRAHEKDSTFTLHDLDVGVIPDTPNLMQVQDTKDLIKAIQSFGEVSVVVVDTFAQVMSGANENAGEDVGKALEHCRRIHQCTGALVILVHHSGKDSSKGARGWSGLRAAADAEIEITRVNNTRQAAVTKMKDGADGAAFGFKLTTVELPDKDEDGEAITSCVVDEGPIISKEPQRGDKVDHDKLVFECMDGLEQVGDNKVMYYDLLNAVKNRLPPPPEGAKTDPRDKQVSKVVEHMQEVGKIVMSGGFVWRAAPVVEDTS
jgi:hypothetical protein